jgi:hypothetical protein
MQVQFNEDSGCSGSPCLSGRAEQAETAVPSVGEADAAALGGAEEAENADPHAVDARQLALHSLSGKDCRCAICLAVMQRRDFAEAGSHPHGEVQCASTPGLHGFADVPTYLDTVDYGAARYYNGGARYDLFGLNPGTGGWLLQPFQPFTDKKESTMHAGFKAMHGPSEDVYKLFIRSDNANEITGAVERDGFAFPIVPHRPNSNRAAHAISAFSNLLRVHLLKSRFAPC